MSMSPATALCLSITASFWQWTCRSVPNSRALVQLLNSVHFFVVFSRREAELAIVALKHADFPLLSSCDVVWVLLLQGKGSSNLIVSNENWTQSPASTCSLKSSSMMTITWTRYYQHQLYAKFPHVVLWQVVYSCKDSRNIGSINFKWQLTLLNM